jgi:hypothetical protein
MGQGQEQVAGLRPLDEPIGHADPRPFGAKSHETWFLREGDKGIDIGADFYSWKTERVQNAERIREDRVPYGDPSRRVDEK